MKNALCRTTLALLLVFICSSAWSAVLPHRSWSQLVFSNGYSPVIYNVESRALTDFFDHMFANKDASTKSVDLLFDSYFGLCVDSPTTTNCKNGSFNWLNTIPQNQFQTLSSGYIAGTGIVQITDTIGDLEVQRVFFSPLNFAGHGFVMAIRVTNNSTTTAHNVSVYSLHNFHLGPGSPFPGTDPENVVYDGGNNMLLENGASTPHQLIYKSLSAPSHWDSLNIYNQLPDKALNDETTDLGFTDNLVPGFQWDLGSVAANGTTHWRGVMVAYGDKANVDALKATVNTFVNSRDAKTLLDDEQKVWSDWQAKAKVPASISGNADRQALFRHSLVVLKMGQVREPNNGDYKPHGQIVASMPPGIWNIAWVRDAAYAIVGLARAGMVDEAKWGLEFMLNGKTDPQYQSYVGHDYLISVTRYFGDGTEESDANVDGPNIEYDNVGLFLWAMVAYIEESNDTAFLATHWPAIRDKVSDLLVKLVDPKNGLITADSSIWEVHWNGKQKQFAYTSITAVRGLCAAGKLAQLSGDTVREATYKQTAASIRQAILTHLVDQSNVIAGNLEELKNGVGYYDAAVFEAINFGLVDPKGTVSLATLAAMDTQFLLPDIGGGYFRNDDGGVYDKQEWVFVDLRMVVAMLLAGQKSKAETLLKWVVDQSKENFWLIAEQYAVVLSDGLKSGDYTGSTPMVGFGPGAYILALRQLDGNGELDACWNDVPNPDPSPEPTPDSDEPDADQPDSVVTVDVEQDQPEPDLVDDLGPLDTLGVDLNQDDGLAPDLGTSDLLVSDQSPTPDSAQQPDSDVQYTILDDSNSLFDKYYVTEGCGCRLNDGGDGLPLKSPLLLFILAGIVYCWRRNTVWYSTSANG